MSLGKTVDSPLDCTESKQSIKGDQSCLFIGRNDVEAETPILRPPDARADSFEKTLILGKIESKNRGEDRG